MKPASFTFALIWSCTSLLAGTLEIRYHQSDPIQQYAAGRIEAAFQANPDYPNLTLRLLTEESLGFEAFTVSVDVTDLPLAVTITGGDSDGVLYGVMEVLEQLQTRGAVEPVGQSPRLEFRAIKFNLPYVPYREGTALRLHAETCRDLAFWERFLDMMVDNRLNTLTLWSLHPFHLMVRNEKYPEACDLSDAELADWQAFWHELFRMAKVRGIDTFIVNWNIFTSPAFAKHHGLEDYLQRPSPNYIGPGNNSPLVVDYMRTSITQVIDTYPDLTGLGASIGERDKNLEQAERIQFVQDTFGDGMKAASRPIRFIHRLPFGKGSDSSGRDGLTTEEMTRQSIESLDIGSPIITEAKFNWSHGHSSPKLIKIHGGPMGSTYWDPVPTEYSIHWMIRNEDFFALRWCEPDFIRKHIELNGHDYVGGYYTGSECYIPAKDYMTAPEFVTGYAFERQWLFYMAWGRLLYNPELTDEVFINECRRRYGNAGEALFKALKLGSRMPLMLGTLFNFSWDYTLYSEGFLAYSVKSNPDKLITVEELIKHPTLDPDYLSVAQYCDLLREEKTVPQGKVSPLEVASDLTRDGKAALELLKPLLSGEPSKALTVELADARAWAYLSLYFADKLRTAVAYRRFLDRGDTAQAEKAVRALGRAVGHWENLVAVTETVYVEMPLANIYRYEGDTPLTEPDTRVFHWKNLVPAVREELVRLKESIRSSSIPSSL